MPKQSKYEKAYQRAKKLQEHQDDDINQRIQKPNYGYKDSEPAVVTKTTLDTQGSKLGRTLLLFVGAIFMLIIAGLALESVINHESPIQYIKEGFTANKPAKWKPSTDLNDKSFNAGTTASDQKAADELEKQGQAYTQGTNASSSSSQTSTASSSSQASNASTNSASTTVSFTN